MPLGLLAEVGVNVVLEWQGGGAGYLLVQKWDVLLLSLAIATVQKFMVTELHWLNLVPFSHLELPVTCRSMLYILLHFSGIYSYDVSLANY